ncbi:small metal-binding protein SmbP [Methylocucumis oryzae]|nr:small metal-binding protein SmbP [Methylocucumis oryzae]
MKSLFAFLTLLFSINFAYAVGEPMNENFTDLINAATQSVELGKQGNSEGFLTSVDAALDVVKEQKMKGDSPKLQRVSTKLKNAKKLGKEGKLSEATVAVEEALAVIK